MQHHTLRLARSVCHLGANRAGGRSAAPGFRCQYAAGQAAEAGTHAAGRLLVPERPVYLPAEEGGSSALATAASQQPPALDLPTAQDD